MTSQTRLLVGTVAGVVLGLVSMKLFPVGIQPGDTLSVGLGGGQETPLTVAAESRAEVIGDVMTEDGKRGRALIAPAQTEGFVHIADGREVYVAGKSPQQAAELLAKESGEKVVSVRIAERRDVRVLPPLANLFY